MAALTIDPTAVRARFSSLRAGFAFLDAPGGSQVPDSVGDAVARSIGEDTTGTQGTPVAVLGKLIAQRQLPELWKARATLVERFDAAKASGRVGETESESERENVRENVRESASDTPQPEETDGRPDD